MWASILGAVAGAATQAGGGLLGSVVNYGHSKKLARYNFDLQQQGLRENPSIQVEGLKDAGFNPMLAVGGTTPSWSGTGSMGNSSFGDLVGSARGGAELANKIKKAFNLQNEKTQAEIENIDADSLRKEAEISLLHSQTERSDLAYGRDIVDTVSDVAGTAGSLYSAKAMRDIARQPKETITTIHHGDKTKPTEIIKTRGTPAVDSSAKGTLPSATPLVGSSSRSAGSIARQVAKDLIFLAPAAAGAYGVGKMQEKAERRIKSDKRSNYGKGYKHFVPRLGL